MASNIPVIVQGNSFSLAIPLQIYYINGDQMDLQDYTPDPTDEVSVQLKGSRRNYTYTPTIDGNVANIDLSGNELADNYSVVVSIVKANGQRLRSFRTDQFFIVESSDDLTTDDIIQGLEENVIYLNASIFVAGEDGRGIESIAKTATAGLVDTYTITYTDATTSTFNVTNGAAGQQGADGVGITSIEKTGTSGLVDTYTITLSNGQTSTFEVTNGRDGHDLGLAVIVDDLTTGGHEDALSAEMGKVLNEKIENKVDDVYMVTSSSLADAVAEVPTEDRKVGLVIGLPGEGTSVRRYKYMGKYYTDVDWLSEGAWLDLDNADKYKVYYNRLCPPIDGTIENANINGNGAIVSGSKKVSGFLEIPECGVSIGGPFLERYALFDNDKQTLLSYGILYGGKTFNREGGSYVRIAYDDNNPLNWKFGYKRGSSGAILTQNPHVEVREMWEDVVDYGDDYWATQISNFIRLKKGETLYLLEKGTGKQTSQRALSVKVYDINKNLISSTSSQIEYVMPNDGYVKVGGNDAQSAVNVANNFFLSKSIACTRGKYRILIVGDSISKFTFDNEQGIDVKEGYPWFIATQDNHEISVTNQAVSGQNAIYQLNILRNKDMSVYDAVTILIGTNDYAYNSTISAFKERITEMVDYIISSNPKCRIGFLTLMHRTSAWDGTAEVANAAGAVLSDYCNAIKEVAQKYGLPVLDLWNECQCNFNFSIYKTNYSSQESEASGDGLHPTNEAHKLFLYPLVREFLKRLL